MNGIIYCRVSSREQIEGTSLESQQAACRDYARAHDINVLKVFVEQGESAKFADRTQLIELLNFCRDNKGKVEVLLVWKVDRFARNVGDHFNIKAILLKYGVRVVSVTEPIDANPEGKLLETILAGFAQFDNDIRAMRTVQGMQRKLQEGIFPWGPPLGYRSANKGEKKMEPDMPDQPLFGLLQKAWQEFATGAYTKAEMRRLMTNWGIHNWSGQPLSNQGVSQLFQNRYYAGVLVNPWSGEEYEGRHIPMVSKADFARVQQIVSRRSRSIPHQKERPEFPLRSAVRCPACRQYMTASFSRGRSARYAYYHCNRPKCGVRTSYATEEVHEEFRTFLGGIAPKPELVDKLGSLITEKAEERLAASKTTHARRKKQRERLDLQKRELITMRAERLINDEEFRRQKAFLSERQFALEGAPESVRVNATEIREHLEEITEPLIHLPETWDMLPSSFQRRFHRLVLPVGFVYGESRTAELGLIFRAFGDLATAKTTGVPLGSKCWNQIMQEIAEFAGLLKGVDAGTEHPDEAVPNYSAE